MPFWETVPEIYLTLFGNTAVCQRAAFNQLVEEYSGEILSKAVRSVSQQLSKALWLIDWAEATKKPGEPSLFLVGSLVARGEQD